MLASLALAVAPRSLAVVHLGLAAGLVTLTAMAPRAAVRHTVLGLCLALTLVLPALWVGPAWRDAAAGGRMPWSFYLSFVASLAIPFAVATIASTWVARRPYPTALRWRLAIPLLGYIAGLLLSYPVSYNYALFYLLLR